MYSLRVLFEVLSLIFLIIPLNAIDNERKQLILN